MVEKRLKRHDLYIFLLKTTQAAPNCRLFSFANCFISCMCLNFVNDLPSGGGGGGGPPPLPPGGISFTQSAHTTYETEMEK